tara:strand:+ start:502 stop:738 length:237 start_codon:yes stop_codon:yes gene_type:complete
MRILFVSTKVFSIDDCCGDIDSKSIVLDNAGLDILILDVFIFGENFVAPETKEDEKLLFFSFGVDGKVKDLDSTLLCL